MIELPDYPGMQKAQSVFVVLEPVEKFEHIVAFLFQIFFHFCNHLVCIHERHCEYIVLREKFRLGDAKKGGNFKRRLFVGVMKVIEVFDRKGAVKGTFTIDDDDYDRVTSACKWSLTNDGYIVNNRMGLLHRWLLNVADRSVVVDHIDNCRTNNSRKNLRIATPSLNSHNKTRSKNHTNKYVGVTWNKNQEKWEVNFCGEGCGVYVDQDHAARVYNHFAVQKYGKDAKINDVPYDPNFEPPVIKRRVSKGSGGVSYHKGKKRWMASLNYDKKQKFLSCAKTEEEAIEIVQKARAKYELAKEIEHLRKPIVRNSDGIAIITVTTKDVFEYALVDDVWWHELSKHAWISDGKGYGQTIINKKMIKMHSFILATEIPEGMVIDHMNHNRLDNRTQNLRIATISQNNQNKRANLNQVLPRGVRKINNKYYARITIDYQEIPLGGHDTPEQAGRAYDAKALEIYGPQAFQNYPQ